MDEVKLLKALAMLQAVEQELPRNGDIKEKYVSIFHQTLADIQSETGQDLTYFSIPSSEIKHHISSTAGRPRIGRLDLLLAERGPRISEDRYCERARFLMALRGAITFVNSLITPSGRRTIGFTQPE